MLECARYQANLKESHLIAVKRIIKYVKTTSNFVVWYDKDTNDVLVGYLIWIGLGMLMTKKVGGCLYLKNNIVS